MFYLLEKNAITNIHILFETHTESVIRLHYEDVIDLVTEKDLKIKNISIDNGVIQIKPWPQSERLRLGKIQEYPKLILLTEISKDNFKIVDYRGYVSYINTDELKKQIEYSNVKNCTYNFRINENAEYKSVDTYKTTADKEFEVYIHKKYEEFIAKTLLLGLDMQFDYRIEGREAKITHYTGKSRKVIIPNFISTICAQSFTNNYIEEVIDELQISEGVKYTGDKAFKSNRIKHVVIPKSVQLMFDSTFIYNKDMYDANYNYDTNALKLLNKNTKIIEGE